MSLVEMLPAGSRHHALLYQSTAGLAEEVVPVVRSAVAAGRTIRLQVGAQLTRLLRGSLGPMADRIEFEPPEIAQLQSVRSAIPSADGRGLTLVRQYPAGRSAARVCALAEDEINTALGACDITVVCVCWRTAPEALRTIVSRSHPTLLDPDGTPLVNEDFRPPRSEAANRSRTWAAPTARHTFGDTAGLAALRERMTSIACDAGLSGYDVAAAVLAVHEAAAALCRGPAADGLESAERIVDVHAGPSGVLVEIRAALVLRGVDRVVPLDGSHRPLRITDFCTYVGAFDRNGVRTVRILLGGPTAAP